MHVMEQELNQSTSKNQPLKLKLKESTSTKPIVEEKKITKEEQPSSKTPRRRPGANGKVIITYKDNAPTYDISEKGGVHMGLIKRDLHRLHREMLVAERNIRVKNMIEKKKINKG